MTLSNLMVRSVTIVHPATVTDRYGNAVSDWNDTTETTTMGWIGRTSATEEHGTRTGAEVETWTLTLADLAVTVTGSDRVVVDGQAFEVDGPIWHAWTPRGEHHLEIDLRAVAG